MPFSFVLNNFMLTDLSLLHLQELQEAILKTQKNAKIEVVEDTPNGNTMDI